MAEPTTTAASRAGDEELASLRIIGLRRRVEERRERRKRRRRPRNARAARAHSTCEATPRTLGHRAALARRGADTALISCSSASPSLSQYDFPASISNATRPSAQTSVAAETSSRGAARAPILHGSGRRPSEVEHFTVNVTSARALFAMKTFGLEPPCTMLRAWAAPSAWQICRSTSSASRRSKRRGAPSGTRDPRRRGARGRATQTRLPHRRPPRPPPRRARRDARADQASRAKPSDLDRQERSNRARPCSSARRRRARPPRLGTRRSTRKSSPMTWPLDRLGAPPRRDCIRARASAREDRARARSAAVVE